MALLIDDNCTACDACKPVCPNEAIAVGDPIYVIDPLKCTECVGAEDEPQCKLVCPADCIVGDRRQRGHQRLQDLFADRLGHGPGFRKMKATLIKDLPWSPLARRTPPSC